MHFLYQLEHPWVLVAIAVVSVARTARLITHDTFPPMEWARPRIAARLGEWADLMVCPFCIGPYLMALQIVWFWLCWNQGPHSGAFVYGWLLPHLWWAASYVAAIVVAYDQPE